MFRISLFGALVAVLAIGSTGYGEDKKAEKKGSKFVAIVTAKDGEKHTLTVKIRAKDTTKTINLKEEGIKLIGEDGKVHTETDFLKDLDVGEEVVVVEKDGKVTEVRDLPPAPKK